MDAFLTVCPPTEGKLNWTDFESILRRQTGEQLQSDEVSVIQNAMASIKARVLLNFSLKNATINLFIRRIMITQWSWTISWEYYLMASASVKRNLTQKLRISRVNWVITALILWTLLQAINKTMASILFEWFQGRHDHNLQINGHLTRLLRYWQCCQLVSNWFKVSRQWPELVRGRGARCVMSGLWGHHNDKQVILSPDQWEDRAVSRDTWLVVGGHQHCQCPPVQCWWHH